ncbi:MAG: CBS domain-containing protein [Micromonosporaceae bacterium]
MSQKVRDVMTGIPITLAPDRTLSEAARTMRDHAVGCVLVAGCDEVRGVVTDRDIVVRAVAEARDPATVTLSDICSGPDLAVVTPDDDVDDAIKIMRACAVRRLPVVDGGATVGFMSLGDLAVDRRRDSMRTLAAVTTRPPRA